MKAVIPYPSASMCGPSVVTWCIKSILEYVDGVDGFVVAVGSDESFEWFTKEAGDSLEDLSKIAIHRVSEKVVNGVSAIRLCLRSCIDALPGEDSVLFVPPWWHAEPGGRIDLKKIVGVDSMWDDVVSIMLAGWLWGGCSGKVNYMPRPCKYDRFVAVQSTHYTDKWVFSVDAPQIVNAKHFRDGGIMRDSGLSGVEAFVKSNYWGRDDVNMVLVPKEQKQMFRDVLCVSPDYRP